MPNLNHGTPPRDLAYVYGPTADLSGVDHGPDNGARAPQSVRPPADPSTPARIAPVPNGAHGAAPWMSTVRYFDRATPGATAPAPYAGATIDRDHGSTPYAGPVRLRADRNPRAIRSAGYRNPAHDVGPIRPTVHATPDPTTHTPVSGPWEYAGATNLGDRRAHDENVVWCRTCSTVGTAARCSTDHAVTVATLPAPIDGPRATGDTVTRGRTTIRRERVNPDRGPDGAYLKAVIRTYRAHVLEGPAIDGAGPRRAPGARPTDPSYGPARGSVRPAVSPPLGVHAVDDLKAWPTRTTAARKDPGVTVRRLSTVARLRLANAVAAADRMARERAGLDGLPVGTAARPVATVTVLRRAYGPQPAPYRPAPAPDATCWERDADTARGLGFRATGDRAPYGLPTGDLTPVRIDSPAAPELLPLGPGATIRRERSGGGIDRRTTAGRTAPVTRAPRRSAAAIRAAAATARRAAAATQSAALLDEARALLDAGAAIG